MVILCQERMTRRPPVIEKRSGHWRVRVHAGRDPLTGKKRYKTGTARTKPEARQLEARLVQEAGAGQHRAAGTRTVAELLNRWYDWRLAVRPIAESTRANYRRLIDERIDPAIGALSLGKVTTATVDDFMAQLRARGGKCQHCYHRERQGLAPLNAGAKWRPRPDLAERDHPTDCAKGLPLAASTVRDVHAVLSGAFKLGMVWGWISRNPVALATPPAVEKADVAPPQIEQAERLIDTAMTEDPELGLFLILAVISGARRGEVCRLRWTHVDLEDGEVFVGGGIVPGEGGGLRDKEWTKNRSKRRVAVGPAVVELLRARRVEQAKEALALGASLPADAYVFSHEPDGSKPIRPDGVSHRFAKLADRVGVDCRLHDLRHFMVTQLISAGVDVRTVAGRAGHRDGGRTTLGTYAHFQAAQDRAAAELMEGLVRFPPGGSAG
jgi:integrase